MGDEIHPLCRQCQAKCCRYFCFQIDEPDSFEEFENLRWYVMHQGITIHIDEGNWFISIENRCQHLDADGRCSNYEDRPLICRQYTTDSCDAVGGDYEYDALFTSAEQIVAYARKALGDKKYDRARAKAYAAAEAAASAEEDVPAKPKKKGKDDTPDKKPGKKPARNAGKAAPVDKTRKAGR